MTTLDDQRIGDSVYRVLYDTSSVSLVLYEVGLEFYSHALGIGISAMMMYVYFGDAPEVILLAAASLPIMLVFVVPFARTARRRSQASRASGAATTSNIEEGMSNVLAIQSLGGAEREGRRFREASEESFRRFRIESFLRLTYQQFGSLAFLLAKSCSSSSSPDA